MKLHVFAENLQKRISISNRAVSSKNQLPILQSLLLETQEQTLIISSTDLEIGIQIKIPARVEMQGSITIPARQFTELINTLPAGEITLELLENKLSVTTKHIKSIFQTVIASDFPKLYQEKGEEWIRFSESEMHKNLSVVIFSASLDVGTKPALSGVLIKKEPHQIIFVATDGYRLSLKQYPHDKLTQKEASSVKSVLIPSRIIKELLAVKFGEGEQIIVYVSKDTNQVLFEANDILVTGRLIEADFPEYEKIIPSDTATKISFEREELLKAVKICSVFARESANIVKFSLRKNGLEVFARTPTLGENSVDIEARLTGEENEIAFNARYLLDLLGNVEEKEMVFEMNGPLNPGVFRIQGDSSFLHIIMPIRITE